MQVRCLPIGRSCEDARMRGCVTPSASVSVTTTLSLYIPQLPLALHHIILGGVVTAPINCCPLRRSGSCEW